MLGKDGPRTLPETDRKSSRKLGVTCKEAIIAGQVGPWPREGQASRAVHRSQGT